MSNTTSFEKDYEVGQFGEAFTVLYFTSNGYEVIDLTRDMETQLLGIDFLVPSKNDPDKMIAIDTKTDTLIYTGNVFFETVSNEGRGTPGCFYTSYADYWHYVFLKMRNEELEVYAHYLIDMKKAREEYTQETLSTRKLLTVKATDGLYNSLGYAIPISELLRKKIIVELKNHGRLAQR